MTQSQQGEDQVILSSFSTNLIMKASKFQQQWPKDVFFYFLMKLMAMVIANPLRDCSKDIREQRKTKTKSHDQRMVVVLVVVVTKKSLLGMPSKREGWIQPSVTSHPPRLTALNVLEGVDPAAKARTGRHESRERNGSHLQRWWLAMAEL